MVARTAARRLFPLTIMTALWNPQRARPWRFAVYIQAIRDDFSLETVGRRLLEEQVTGEVEIGAIFLVCPDASWAGEPNPRAHVSEVERAANALAAVAPRVAVRCVAMEIGRLIAGTSRRIEVETRVRNAALKVIGADGWRDVLIVDNDEVWKRGTLRALGALLRRAPWWRPWAGVWSWVVPVLGVPGYPVEGATDKAFLYVRLSRGFEWGRIPRKPHAQLPGWNVWHFVGTRATQRGVAEKARRNGHYDDNEYDFERWLSATLPSVRPGATDVHAYREAGIWPKVRAWRASDLADIPEALHGLLGPEREAEP